MKFLSGELGDGLEEKSQRAKGGLNRAADEAFPVEGCNGGDKVEGVPVRGLKVVRDDGVELPTIADGEIACQCLCGHKVGDGTETEHTSYSLQEGQRRADCSP